MARHGRIPGQEYWGMPADDIADALLISKPKALDGRGAPPKLLENDGGKHRLEHHQVGHPGLVLLLPRLHRIHGQRCINGLATCTTGSSCSC
jgi:hypothetical protein